MTEHVFSKSQFFGQEKISKILFQIAPPVMLAQLIQALYNIVDSLFVGRYADSGLTALSIIYPIQLLMIALAVGTGVGINTAMASRYGVGQKEEAKEFAGVGTPLAIALWFVFALVCWIFMPTYAKLSTSSPEVISDVVTYGRIVCVFSLGLFLESVWTKILQANGDMKTPMFAQILGAVTNIVLDPLLIFGWFGLPEMGIAGAAVATVAGQMVAAFVVMKKGCYPSPQIRLYGKRIMEIFRLGVPNILMQSAYTFYIFGLNLILSSFSDQAVTALGLYYKWQTFFFIPLGAMQTCIVPIISFNYAARKMSRCKQTLTASIVFGIALMAVGTLCFETIPGPMLSVFTADEKVIEIGKTGFRWIGISFIPMVTSLIFPVFFPSGWIWTEKFPADDCADDGSFCSSRFSVCAVWLRVVLGYLPRYRAVDHRAGARFLPAISGPPLCQGCAHFGSSLYEDCNPAIQARGNYYHCPSARLFRQRNRPRGRKAFRHPLLL